MAELAAIGLASNILQFLEVGIRIFMIARQKYKSSSGSREEDQDFVEDTERVKALANLIHKGRSDPSAERIAEIDVRLYQILNACNNAAADLVEILQRFSVGSERNRAWESFRKALYQELRKTEIEKKEQRLQRLQKSLTSHLMASTRDQQSLTVRLVRDLQAQNNRLEANTTTKLESIQSLLLETRESGTDKDKVTKLISRLDKLKDEAMRVQKQQGIIKSLFFSRIKQRQIAIQERHKATFEWIFKSNQTSFCQWLEKGDDFFWVKGKAGSGKSTLMKFLATHTEAQARLRTWAGNQRVIIASHFFWNAGNEMQKSLTGLLQTLLYQILKDCPEVIEDVCASRWTMPTETLSLESWDDGQLLSTLTKLSCLKSLPLKFCFFIDGLDEYTAGARRYGGTFAELIHPLKTLASSGSIKICVSSRPWTAFVKSFGQSDWQVQLEDLTREDIRRYVTEELSGNSQFEELAQRDKRCLEIPDIIVQRAQGVFLWVYLIVLSLKRGLYQDDNYFDLQKRLEQLPDDLEDYFKHMLQSIENIYWDQTTRIFRITIDAEQPLPLLGFEYLDRETEDPGYAITMQSRSMSQEDIQNMSLRARTRLNARCRDLLYVADTKEKAGILQFQVDFLHRTVRDFFIDTDVLSEMIKQKSTRAFDPHLSLCKIMLALSKTMPIDKSNSQLYNQVFTFTDSLMYYALQIEERCIHGEQEELVKAFDILDELDRSMSTRMNLDFHWMNVRDPPKGLLQEYRKKTFLAGAIQARLSSYVKMCLEKDMSQLRQKGGRPLLDYALRPTMVTPLRLPGMEQGPVLPVVKFLLDLGAKPNAGIYVYDGRTPWQLFLLACHTQSKGDPDSENMRERIGETLALMLSHGAKPDCSVQLEDGTEVGIMEIIYHLGLSTYQFERVMALLEERRAGSTPLAWLTSWFV